jgi:hypothetical protein
MLSQVFAKAASNMFPLQRIIIIIIFELQLVHIK